MTKKAFTLAEVLITLSIIGVVAALTIPTLIQNASERATVAKLKKVYSTLTNAYQAVTAEEGSEDWAHDNTVTTERSYVAMQKLLDKIKTTKNCDNVRNGGNCFANGTYKLISGGSTTINNDLWYYSYKRLTIDGVAIFGTLPWAPDGATWMGPYKIYGPITVDLNGPSLPNVYGQDLFAFIFTDKGIIPTGTPNMYVGGGFDFAPNNTNQNQAAWIIYNENMDYLHCSDLAWNGKHKCN